jgi:exonuclease III
MNETNVFLGGDFNLHLDRNLDTNSDYKFENNNKTFRIAVENFLSENKLVDPARIKYSSKKLYTWFRNKQKSRLDYIFISEHLLNTNPVYNMEICPLSDHCFIEINLNIKKTTE